MNDGRNNGFNKYTLSGAIHFPTLTTMAQPRPRSKLPSSRRTFYDEYTQDEVASIGPSDHRAAVASVNLKPGSWSDGRIDNERASGSAGAVPHDRRFSDDEVFIAADDADRAACASTVEQRGASLGTEGGGGEGLLKEECSGDMTPQRGRAYCGKHCLNQKGKLLDIDGGGHGDCESGAISELSTDGDLGRNPPDGDAIESQMLYSPSKRKLGLGFPNKEVRNDQDREITANGTPADEIDFPREDLPVSCIDILANIFSIGSYLLDVGSDIWMVYLYYTRKHWWWFTFTLTAVIVPSLVMTLFSLSWYIQDHRFEKKRRRTKTSPLRWISRFMFLFLQIAPVLRYIDALIYGLKSLKLDPKKEVSQKRHWYHQMIYEDVDSALLRLFECFMEAAPQLTLQLYIMQTNGMEDGIILVIGQTVACVTALISLSWALVAYHKALRYSLPNKANMTYAGIAMQFCWRLFTISARVAAMALFASTFVHWVFILAGIHWMIMLVWILLQRTQFCKSRCQEFFFDIVMALVYIFCYVNLIDGHTRLRYLFYYIVVYIENTIMILGWYTFAGTTSMWYVHPALIAVFLGFFIGVVFQISYYVYCHPNNYPPNLPSQRIQLWIPCKELRRRPEHSMCETGDPTEMNILSQQA